MDQPYLLDIRKKEFSIFVHCMCIHQYLYIKNVSYKAIVQSTFNGSTSTVLMNATAHHLGELI